jgi:hypothetical protein
VAVLGLLNHYEPENLEHFAQCRHAALSDALEIELRNL